MTYQLLSREDFDRLVKERSSGSCVFCNESATDAHHVMDRKLFPDGGYYLENGAAVCEHHHWLCETTEISVEAVRTAAGITDPILPPGFDPSKVYDKWGNEIVSAVKRIPGPLVEDTGMQRALSLGGVYWHLYL